MGEENIVLLEAIQLGRVLDGEPALWARRLESCKLEQEQEEEKEQAQHFCQKQEKE